MRTGPGSANRASLQTMPCGSHKRRISRSRPAISRQSQRNDDGELHLEQYGFGLFGPNGALPLHLTELAYERRRQLDDHTIVDFLNVFQHRLISLFYRAWADSEPAVSLDRPRQRSLSRLRWRASWHCAGERARAQIRSPITRSSGGWGGSRRSRARQKGSKRCSPTTSDCRWRCARSSAPGSIFRVIFTAASASSSSASAQRSAPRRGSASTNSRSPIGPLSRAEFGNFLPGAAGAR